MPSSGLRYAALAALVLAIGAVPVRAQSGERKITLDQVPARVKAAILKEVGDGRLVDVGTWKEGEAPRFEIEMVVDGKEYDVLFDADGKMLRKSFEGLKPRRPAEGAPAQVVVGYQGDFDLESREFATTGRNRYFILEPGYRLVLEGKEGEKTVQLVVTVLEETRKIGSIETRVVEERESVDGELVEISRNFLARCKATSSIFYFGEEVDLYEDGKVVAHEGAWLHGQDGARAGLMMPGEAVLGASYYQEVAPKVAMDRARIVDVKARLETPAGKFEGCLRCQEENPLDGEREFKIHAPGVGLIQDEDLLLVKYGFVGR